MSNLVNRLYKNSTIIYKIVLFLVTVTSIVYLFPKGVQFKYDFNKGKPWQYENLYAPFDFAIQKNPEEIIAEKKEITVNTKPYFKYDQEIVNQVKAALKNRLKLLQDNDSLSNDELQKLTQKGMQIVENIYKKGYVDESTVGSFIKNQDLIVLKKKNKIQTISYQKLLTTKEVLTLIDSKLNFAKTDDQKKELLSILSEILKPNVFYDEQFTNKMIDEAIKDISYTKGKVSKGELIILKGDIVEGKKLAVLRSLKKESESQVWTRSNYYWIVFGYTVLVSLALLML